MDTTLDCLVCFMRQALTTARLSTRDSLLQRRVVNEAGAFLSRVEFGLTPPENAVDLYQMIARLTGVGDPFAELKSQGNELALAMRDTVRKRIRMAPDPLLAAVRFAIGGNIIDYAAQHSFDVDATMAACLESPFLLDSTPALVAALDRRPEVLYLADNAGEIVFDGLLVEELLRRDCRVTLVVREGAIINDATMEDVRACGLDGLCPVITSGAVCPGTPLAHCSSEFKELFHRADLIISKGMGNYETLSDVVAPLFFLFTVKCQVVAEDIRRRMSLAPGSVKGEGEMVVMEQKQS
ncbi:damage-control phosphatase ARMT1 family protein [Desulfolithobacter sp.]